MKKLGIQAMFLLPDDFNGTFPQALRLLADHLEDETEAASSGPKTSDAEIEGWNATSARWWEAVLGGSKFAGHVGLFELDESANAWVRKQHGIKVKAPELANE